jgi:hypothetical protein
LLEGVSSGKLRVLYKEGVHTFDARKTVDSPESWAWERRCLSSQENGDDEGLHDGVLDSNRDKRYRWYTNKFKVPFNGRLEKRKQILCKDRSTVA